MLAPRLFTWVFDPSDDAAMSQKTVSAVSRFAARPGEGAASVSVRRHEVAPGSAEMILEMDIGSAQVPDRRYHADTACVVEDADGIQIMFGQRKVGAANDGLRSLIVIHVSPDALGNWVHGAMALYAQLSEIRSKAAFPAVEFMDPLDEPAQTVAFAANLMVSAFAGNEATMDFYHASSFAFDVAKRSSEMPVEPIVRVTLASRLMLAVFERMKQCAKVVGDTP